MTRKNSPTSPTQSGTQGIGAKMLATCAQIPAGTVLQLLTYSAALAMGCLIFAWFQFSPSQNPEPQTARSQVYTSTAIPIERVLASHSPMGGRALSVGFSPVWSHTVHEVSGTAHGQHRHSSSKPFVQRQAFVWEVLSLILFIMVSVWLTVSALTMSVCLVPTTLPFLLPFRAEPRPASARVSTSGKHSSEHALTNTPGITPQRWHMLPSPARNLGREPAVTPDLTGAVREKLWYTMVTQGATQGLAAGVFSVALTSAIFCLSAPLTGSLGLIASVLALVSIGAWWWFGTLLSGTLAAVICLFRDLMVGRRTVSVHGRWAQDLARNALALCCGCALLWFVVLDIRQPGAYGMRLLEVVSLSTHEAVKGSAAVYFLVSVVIPGLVGVCAYCVAMYGLCGVVAQALAWSSQSSAYRVGVHLGQQQGAAGLCVGGYTLLSAALFLCGFYLPSLNNWPDMKVAVIFPGFVLVTVAAAATLAAWAKWFMWEPTPTTQGKAHADAVAAIVLGIIPVGIGLAVFLMNAPDLNAPREQWWSTGACWALTALGIPSLARVIAHKTGDWLMRTPHQT